MNKQKFKIWKIDDNIYRSEKGFREAIVQYGDLKEYEILTVTETGTAKEVKEEVRAEKEQRARDLSIREILSYLTPEEIKERSFARDVENLYKIISEIEKERCYYANNSICSMLGDVKHDRKKTVRLLKELRPEFLKYTYGKKYYKALLKIHPFRDLK